MEKANLNSWVLKFKRSRDNLMLMIVFTVINLLLLLFQSDFYLLFSATVPTLTLAIGQYASADIGSNIPLWITSFIAVAIVGFYIACWAFSKKARLLILIAFIFFSIDTFILLVLMLVVEFDLMMLVDLAFHFWILYYLYHGAMAWSKLSDVSQEDFTLSLANITITEEKILNEVNKKEENQEK